MAALPQDLLLSLTETADVRALFEKLGFTPRTQITYSPQVLQWPDNVAVDLGGRSFELLADADNGYFQVLFLGGQKKPLSLKLQRALFTSLQNTGHDGLLVVMNDQRDLLHLIWLTDRRSDEELQHSPLSFPEWNFDPRAIRPHQLRALELLDVSATAGPAEIEDVLQRAFGRAQQETLFRSQGFFSSYYLEQRIVDDAEIGVTWAAARQDMPALAGRVRAALEAAPDTAVDAILAALGWEVAADAGSALGTLRRDGVDVARWAAVPHDMALEQQVADDRYPQLNLIAALEREKQANGLRWGILTNGRVWRLYSTLTTSISGVYYEIDLADLLAFGDDDDLRYFAAFFGPAGLAVTDEPRAFVERVFYASQTLAQQVGESLKKIVFDRVFPELANGIADDLRRRGEYTGSDEQHQLIFRATLILLYRLLFLLYAESRRLLPTLHTAYYPHSLTRLITDIAIQRFLPAHHKRPLGEADFWAWDWLHDLFAAVNRGNSDWGVPVYNGGLFGDGHDGAPYTAPQRLLGTVRIGALFLHKAVDLLGRDEQARLKSETLEEAWRLIDYAALDVRRLGSIYEGLLEYRLEQTSDQALRLVNTAQARKASGSYYTPDYIVAYIVEQAVGPVLAERVRRFEELMPQLAARRKEFERSRSTDARITLDEQIRLLEHAASEALLDLKVLDPAMGSGHFLVEAVDFLTDRLIQVLQRYPGNPIFARLAAIRNDIRASLARQQIGDEFISDQQLSDARLLRRMVMKRCVYGVDLNDMAVELAKLSLWLHSFTVGAPLSFLDHHLKWGNSLIGARVQEVQRAMEGKDVGLATQFDMFSSNSAFAEMLNLASTIEHLVQIADANGEQVEQSAELYASYEQSVVPVKRLLDLWTSQFFGSKEASQLIRLYSGSRQEVSDLVEALMGRAVLSPDFQPGVERSRALFSQHRFLHWDLDFPEVFIDLQRKTWKAQEEAGFDAVVGNPPYLPVTLISAAHKAYFSNVYETAQKRSDIFALFISKTGKDLVRREGIVGLIVPTTFFDNSSYKLLRLFLYEQTRTLSMWNLGDDIFPDAKNDVCILVFRKSMIRKEFQVIDTSYGRTNTHTTTHENFFVGADLSISTKIKDFDWKKVYDQSIILGAISDSTQGYVTGLTEAFVVSDAEIYQYEDARDLLKPLVSGQHIGRYEEESSNQFLIYLTKKVDITKYPSLLHKLLPYKETLTKRREVERGIIPWYSLQWPRHPHFFESPNALFFQKIRNLQLKRRVVATLNSNRCYGESTINVMRLLSGELSALFILSIVNSKLVNKLFLDRYTDITIKLDYLKNIPIRRISFTTPAAERERLAEKSRALYTQFCQKQDYACVLGFVEHHLPLLEDGTPDTAAEHSDVIHDLLAFLAEQMIDLNKQKQAIAAQLIGWLERETDSRIEEWANKTAVQEFWAQEWITIEQALQRNRGKFAQTRGLRGREAGTAMEPLIRSAQIQWEASRATLEPVLATIAATDTLIDRIVYRLYGLTDAEIALVEAA